jgi:hypothetical protein
VRTVRSSAMNGIVQMSVKYMARLRDRRGELAEQR